VAGQRGIFVPEIGALAEIATVGEGACLGVEEWRILGRTQEDRDPRSLRGGVLRGLAMVSVEVEIQRIM
jgi:hypothetical protein